MKEYILNLYSSNITSIKSLKEIKRHISIKISKSKILSLIEKSKLLEKNEIYYSVVYRNFRPTE